MKAVTRRAFAYQIHPDGCESSQENALERGGALAEAPIRGCPDFIPVALQFPTSFYSCVWSAHFFMRETYSGLIPKHTRLARHTNQLPTTFT